MTASQYRSGVPDNWFVDPAKRLTVVSLTNTALEGMPGRYVRDLRAGVYEEFGA